MQEVVKDKLEDRLDRLEADLRDLPDRILAWLPKSEPGDGPPGLELDRTWTPSAIRNVDSH